MQTNKQIEYAPNDKVKSFTDIETNQFGDYLGRTAQQQIDQINYTANQCRWWYEPVFADDHKFLPISSGYVPPTSSGSVAVAVAPQAQDQQKDQTQMIVNSALIAISVFAVYKLLS